MFKKILAAALVVAVAMSTTGCLVRRVPIKDTQESRDLSGFERISYGGMGTLQVLKGPSYSVTISGPSDVVKAITTKVVGDTLEIGTETAFVGLSTIGSNGRIHIDVVMPSLRGVKVSGACDANVSGFTGGDLDLETSGAGHVSCSDVSLDKLNVRLSGAGSVRCAGTSRQQEANLSGAGSYDAADLETADTRVTLSGAGEASVWATGTLDVSISGAASVDYYGNPSVTKNISGAGSVRQRDVK